MSPPKLAADAPVLDVAHPVVINLRPPLRMEAHGAPNSDSACFFCVSRRADSEIGAPRLLHARAGFFHARIFQEPLLAQARLNRHIRAFAITDVVRVRFLFFQCAKFRELFHGNLARLETVESLQIHTREVVHVAIGGDDFNLRQLVALADFEVRLVVRRRHLEHAGAELKIHVLVADDGDELLLAREFGGQGTDDVFADVFRIARVFRIHGHGGVAGNCLRPGGGDGQKCSRRFGDFDFEIIERALLLFHDYFLVGQRGERNRTPVHHTLAAIDEAFFVKLDKHLLDAARIFRVHREPFARPIARRAELLELLDDDAAVLFLPLPDAFEKFFAAEIVAVPDCAGFLENFLHHRLRGDAGVVGAGQPEDFLAVHARLAGEDVLDGVVEDVAHGKHAGDIRRRDDDGIRRALGRYARRVGGEAVLLQPEIIPLVLNGLRLIGLGNLGHKSQGKHSTLNIQHRTSNDRNSMLGVDC